MGHIKWCTALLHSFTDCTDDIEIKRFTYRPGLFRAIEHRKRFKCFWQKGNKMFYGKRAVQPDLDNADFLSLCIQIPDRLLYGLRTRTHDNNNTLCIQLTHIVKKTVAPSCKRSKPIHGLLDKSRGFVIIAVDTLTSLKIDIRVLRRTADKWIIRRQGPLSMRF